FNKKEKIDINYTKIFYTIKNDNVEDFKEIYNKYGNNIYKIKNKNNQNIIHLICLNNSVNILKEVIDKTEKKYLIEYDNLGNYPLKYAIIKNNIEIIEILILRVEKEQRDHFLGFTPFLTATFSNKLEILKILYQNGCNINATDLKFNNNALFWASRKYNLEIIKYLIQDLKMDVKKRDKEGNTTFFEACSSFVNDKQKCFDTLEFLYSLDNNLINIPNNEGVYPIMIATYNYNIFPIIFIINKNKNSVFQKDNEENNIIDYLILTENEKIIKNLISILREYYSKEDLIKLLKNSISFKNKENLKNDLESDKLDYKKYLNLIAKEIYK
ncbi:MAG: ankyrin repeat domain-containing protein, partial [bacterium]